MRRAHLLLPALLCACAPPTSPDAPEVTVGTIDLRRHGDARWVDIQDGQDAELAPGAQGGFHIWLHYRVRGASGRIPVARLADRLRDGRRDRVLTTEGTITISEGQEVWGTEDPIPNFMCPAPVGVNVVDEIIEMSVTLLRADRRPLAGGAARVRARCPPEGDPQREFCLHICRG